MKLSTDEVRRSFKSVKSKAPGPDAIPGRALRACATQLAEEFTNILYLSRWSPPPSRHPPLFLSLRNERHPAWMTATVLTSLIIMKCFQYAPHPHKTREAHCCWQSCMSVHQFSMVPNAEHPLCWSWHILKQRVCVCMSFNFLRIQTFKHAFWWEGTA